MKKCKRSKTPALNTRKRISMTKQTIHLKFSKPIELNNKNKRYLDKTSSSQTKNKEQFHSEPMTNVDAPSRTHQSFNTEALPSPTTKGYPEYGYMTPNTANHLRTQSNASFRHTKNPYLSKILLGRPVTSKSTMRGIHSSNSIWMSAKNRSLRISRIRVIKPVLKSRARVSQHF